MDTETTVVIFRAWPKFTGGGVTAIFPERPGDLHGYSCKCFDLDDGHGVCRPAAIIRNTRPATAAELAETRERLTGVYDYRLREYRRMTPGHDRRRMAAATEERAALARENERSGELDIGESAY